MGPLSNLQRISGGCVRIQGVTKREISERSPKSGLLSHALLTLCESQCVGPVVELSDRVEFAVLPDQVLGRVALGHEAKVLRGRVQEVLHAGVDAVEDALLAVGLDAGKDLLVKLALGALMKYS